MLPQHNVIFSGWIHVQYVGRTPLDASEREHNSPAAFALLKAQLRKSNRKKTPISPGIVSNGMIWIT